MTVSTELSHEEYVGNGVTTDFDFRFRIFEGKHLIVVVADSEGNETTLKNGTDYAIVGAGSYHGGKVILNKPLAKGWKILLERDLPVVQETDLRNQGKFFAEVHEDAFDYLTMLIQKALGTFSLSLRKPTYLSNYYDAKGNRIANLAPPKFGSDSANKDYVDNSIKDIDSKTLRVKDKPINALPNTEQRANKILAFDRQGQPILVLPESGSASDVFLLLDDQDGFSYIGYCNSIAKLKEISPRYLYQKQPVLGFYDDTPNIGGGMFISDLSNKYYIDNWMVFPSGNSEFVWVREEKEKGRSVLNCGARKNDDITQFLQLAADNGWVVYQDNHYDVKTTGGINISVGIRIVGDQITNGRIVLNSTISDEIFNPDKVNDCWFKSENGRYKGESSVTNTPYVCGVKMDDPESSLIEFYFNSNTLTDIGVSADMKYGDENVYVEMNKNTIDISKLMSDKIINTGRINLRGIIRTTCFPYPINMVLESPKYGSSTISSNKVKAFMPSPGNQDIGKISGMFLHQKVSKNHFWNTNLKSGSEVDFYCGIESGTVVGNTFRNVSSKFMTNSSSEVGFLVVKLSTITGNSWVFDDGAVNNYGVYMICDLSTFTSNTIRNNQQIANGQFIGIWTHVSHDAGVMGSTIPIGNVISSNVVDIRCEDYNSNYWRPIESPSVLNSSVIIGNVFCGGSLRALVGGNNLMANNSFINVSIPMGVDLRTYNGLNSSSKVTSGVVSDGRDASPVVGKESSKNVAGVVAPWVKDDVGLWTLLVQSSSDKGRCWQQFQVSANSSTGVINQTSGRYLSVPSDENLKNIFFTLNIATNSITLSSVGVTSDSVSLRYRWIQAIR